MAESDLDVDTASLQELQQALSDGRPLNLTSIVHRIQKELCMAAEAAKCTKEKVDETVEKIKSRKAKSGKHAP